MCPERQDLKYIFYQAHSFSLLVTVLVTVLDNTCDREEKMKNLKGIPLPGPVESSCAEQDPWQGCSAAR